MNSTAISSPTPTEAEELLSVVQGIDLTAEDVASIIREECPGLAFHIGHHEDRVFARGIYTTQATRYAVITVDGTGYQYSGATWVGILADVSRNHFPGVSSGKA